MESKPRLFAPWTWTIGPRTKSWPCLKVEMNNYKPFLIVTTWDAAQAFAVIEYGMDFLDQFRSVLERDNENGAFITSCICHGGCNWLDPAFDDGSHRKDGTGRMMSPIEHYARWTKGESLGTSSFFVDESIIPNQDAKLGRKDKCLPFYAGTNN